MHRPPQLLTSLLLLGIGLALTAATSAARSRPVKIKWPSRESRDLQSAIDAAPDNAIVEIKAGVYEVSDPILVRGKRLVIKGAGSGFAGATARTPITHLIGPPPSPVLDERGDLVLRAEAVQGLWNFVAAGGVIQDMNLTGFDAAIVHKPGDRGDTGPVEVRNVVISHTGRGILSLSASNLSVESCTITNTRWNDISFAPRFISPGLLPTLQVKATVLVEPEGAGIYFANTLAFLDGVTVLSADTGGVVGIESASLIQNSDFIGNRKAGILLVDGSSQIESNLIQATQVSLEGVLGDGVTLWSLNQQMQAHVSDNLIFSSARAGISSFGAWLDLMENDIFCATFDLFGADSGNFQFQLNDLSGNQCGCGQIKPCAAMGDGLEPPPPVGGLE